MSKLTFLTSCEVASMRLRMILYHVKARELSGEADSILKIGKVRKDIKKPANPELVPVGYANQNVPKTVQRHLKWIMQKDNIQQDVFLIGNPGPLRRIIVMQYLELTKSELEYIRLSRDTTESDLKQRREIISGTAHYIDQCAVRAAIHGRVLVLDGIEKTERNVLPILNNLLENREMQLDDGRFLMAADRYDSLLKTHSKEELDARNLVRVSKEFRVIALGLPVPKYMGNPLDPPLRSRFQARDVEYLPYQEYLQSFQKEFRNIPKERLVKILSYGSTLLLSEDKLLGLPDFPLSNLYSVAKILDSAPEASTYQTLYKLYPYELILGYDGKMAAKHALQMFDVVDKVDARLPYRITDIKPSGNGSVASVTLQSHTKNLCHIEVPMGKNNPLRNVEDIKYFVPTSYHSGTLADMILSHMMRDFCLIGPKGCGKTLLVQSFADILGYHTENVVLYQDMTARDLLQQRVTLENGDTTWRNAPLITAALEGYIAILDGLHRLNPSTLMILQRLIDDRELTLHDGTRLMSVDKYKLLQESSGLSETELQERSILPIHPTFRIIGLAEPKGSSGKTSGQQWLNSELLTLFLHHEIRPLTKSEEIDVIKTLVPRVPEQDMGLLMKFTHSLRNNNDPTVQSISSSLSTRQLLRISRRLASYPNENLRHSIYKACLSKFLPPLASDVLENGLKEAEFVAEKLTDDADATYKVENDSLRIGKITTTRYKPDSEVMVPDVLFYDNLQHIKIMEDMLKDFLLGEHLLLIGNQGVGKNKIVDRFLHLLNRPRQYIQLHRDTTVQGLTLQPSVRDGQIIFEDSPLVNAVRNGHVLVVDEADKAPTHVTCILKALVESGEMLLADGRKIVTGVRQAEAPENAILAHKDFRLVVLANRPGFPFLGNDFFGSLGDIFSCHAIDNPPVDSEVAMLKKYGPDVPEEVIRKLVAAFGELRHLADDGQISYPYSTREVVNVVRHLQKYPNDGIANVVKNVFDFDNHQNELMEVVISTLRKHDIPIGASIRDIRLAKSFPLPPPTLMSNWTLSKQQRSFKPCSIETSYLIAQDRLEIGVDHFETQQIKQRSIAFNELLSTWQLFMHSSNRIAAVATTKDGKKNNIYAATCNPVSVYAMEEDADSYTFLDLYGMFPSTRYRWKPSLTISALGNSMNDCILLHEETSNTLMLVWPRKGEIQKIHTKSRFARVRDSFTRRMEESEELHKICNEFSHENWVVTYREHGSSKIHNINRKYLLKKEHETDLWPTILIQTEQEMLSSELQQEQDLQLSSKATSEAIVHKFLDISNIDNMTNRIVSDDMSYAGIAVGLPDNFLNDTDTAVGLFKVPRTLQPEKNSEIGRTVSDAVFLSSVGQVARIVKDVHVPEEISKEESSDHFIEVVDLQRHVVRFLPLPRVPRSNYVYTPGEIIPYAINALPDDRILVIDSTGRVTLWETGFSNLESSLDKWMQLVTDEGAAEDTQITIERPNDLEVTDPKHGKEDPSNAPHVGGNTWAGGTGGRSTAGLGGRGGPYRLDAGHDVYQVSDTDKEVVPPEISEAARKMNRKAFQDRLREIEMSEYDADAYDKVSNTVQRQVKALRVILDSLEAKGLERTWAKNQTTGDLDDNRLIEGLTGERTIYKRRADKEPEYNSQDQEHPKRLRLAVDVSGSMYRFNGVDGRLQRTLEATCMLMEAFENYDQKFQYEIFGHSGEDPEIPFIRYDKAPKNNKERLKVLKAMHAHSQFCFSGDTTMEATKNAVEKVVEDEADEHFVIILSDANLERYGLNAAKLGAMMSSDPRVNVFFIFIGSLGNQAERLKKKLPAGHAFVCMNTKDIPQILQQIFTSTMLLTR
ncbi:uncharacterized protein TRIADDRAFT_52086 [Trichoplax adhaerens]|uniref:von Willebrand factor A domain-containing protein 8 n=1 Tax=Trichoplax adhaerens TaxID=10228 RepID=B3RLQ7_TRIAD|nr:hypothetical protein TRIADDRAFT_52086 [Trichoplax adhaerens]EDV28824.1 hypothetical protein TRIADDRAFT_52086 [Trichoplax adhaerens]|eukprot:XP_002108026.1 hypothetical protein TRIADDRAFT_52086 [Trichoplax adhaerens]